MEYEIESYFYSSEIDENTVNERLRQNQPSSLNGAGSSIAAIIRATSGAAIGNDATAPLSSNTTSDSASPAPPPRDVIVANNYVAVLLHDGTLAVTTHTPVFDAGNSAGTTTSSTTSRKSTSHSKTSTTAFRSSTTSTTRASDIPFASTTTSSSRAKPSSRKCRRLAGGAAGSDSTTTSSSSPYATIPPLMTSSSMSSHASALMGASHAAHEMHVFREREYLRMHRERAALRSAAIPHSLASNSTSSSTFASRRANLINSMEQLRRETAAVAAASTAPTSASAVEGGSHNVPEHLIEQVQAILRRPRPVIIRELLRANLDVNHAVNILLSRDDSAADEEADVSAVSALSLATEQRREERERRRAELMNAANASAATAAAAASLSTALAAQQAAVAAQFSTSATAPTTVATTVSSSAMPLNANHLLFGPISSADADNSSSSEFFRAFASARSAGEDFPMFGDVDMASAGGSAAGNAAGDGSASERAADDSAAAQYALDLSNAVYNTSNSSADGTVATNMSVMVEPSPLSLRHFATSTTSSSGNTAFHDPSAAIGAPPPNYGSVSTTTTSSSSLLHVPPPSALYYSHARNVFPHRNAATSTASAGGSQVITATSNKRHALDQPPPPPPSGDHASSHSGVSGQFKLDGEKWKLFRSRPTLVKSDADFIADSNDSVAARADPYSSIVKFRFIAQMKSHLIAATLDTGRLVQIDPTSMSFVTLSTETDAATTLSDENSTEIESPVHTAAARFPILLHAQVVQLEACPLRATMVIRTPNEAQAKSFDPDANLYLLTIVDDSFGTALSTDCRQKLEGCMPLRSIRQRAMQAVLVNNPLGAGLPSNLQSGQNVSNFKPEYTNENDFYDSSSTQKYSRLVREIRSCAFYSVVTLCNGHSYWFGVPPFGYRLWDSSTSSSTSTTVASDPAGAVSAAAAVANNFYSQYSVLTPDNDAESKPSSAGEISAMKHFAANFKHPLPAKSTISTLRSAGTGGVLEVGSAVRLKSRAVIEAGAVAVRIRDGLHVSCGTLLEPCWGTSDIADGIKLEFQIINAAAEQPPPGTPSTTTTTNSGRRIVTAKRFSSTLPTWRNRFAAEPNRETSAENSNGWNDDLIQIDTDDESTAAARASTSGAGEKRKLSEWVDLDTNESATSASAGAPTSTALSTATSSAATSENASAAPDRAGSENSNTSSIHEIFLTPHRPQEPALPPQSSSPFSPRAHYSPPPATPYLAPPQQPQRTERWPLNEVVFLQQKGSSTVGTVLKLDGPLAAVYFGDTNDAESEMAVRQILLAARGEKQQNTPETQQNGGGASLTYAVLQQSRLIKREDLIVVGKVDFSSTSATPAAATVTTPTAASVGIAVSPRALNHLPFINYGSSRSVICCDVVEEGLIYALIGSTTPVTTAINHHAESSRLSIVCYSLAQQNIIRTLKFSASLSPPITRAITKNDNDVVRTIRPKISIIMRHKHLSLTNSLQPFVPSSSTATNSSTNRARMSLNPTSTAASGFAPVTTRANANNTNSVPSNLLLLLTDCYGVPYSLVPDATGRLVKPLFRQNPLAPVNLIKTTLAPTPPMNNTSASSNFSGLATIFTIVRQSNPVTKLITSPTDAVLTNVDAELTKIRVNTGSLIQQTRFHYDCNVLHALAQVEANKNASKFLQAILSTLDSKAVRSLLCERNTLFSGGMTPIQFAVYVRAYDTASVLLEHAEKLQCAREALMPSDAETSSGGELSPLVILARNTLCAFRFTGSDHVQQYVYECRTCGLVNSLCCCASCAFNCHRGHECRLKKASPSAFCDCQQMCCNGYCLCMKLSASEPQHSTQPMQIIEKKMQLFQRLLRFPFLLGLVSNNGENLLHFIINNASRELEEHRQYLSALTRSIKPSSSSSSSSNISTSKSNLLRLLIAEHSFTLRAVRAVMQTTDAVRICILAGAFHMRQIADDENESEEEFLLNSQHVVVFLDKFCSDLLIKSQPNDSLADFIASLKAILQSEAKENDAKTSNFSGTEIVERFLRSLWRVYCAMRVQVSLRLGWHVNHQRVTNKKSGNVVGGVELNRAIMAALDNNTENSKNSTENSSKSASNLAALTPYRRHMLTTSSSSTNNVRVRQQQAAMQAIMASLNAMNGADVHFHNISSSSGNEMRNSLRGALADYAAAAGASSSSSNSRRLRRQQAAMLQQHNDMRQADIEACVMALTTVLAANSASKLQSAGEIEREQNERAACASLMALAVVPVKLNSTAQLSVLALERWTASFEMIMDAFPVQALKILSEAADAVVAPLRSGMMMPTFVRLPKSSSVLPAEMSSRSSAAAAARHLGAGGALSRLNSRSFSQLLQQHNPYSQMPFPYSVASSSLSSHGGGSSSMDVAYALANTFTVPLGAVRSSATAGGAVETHSSELHASGSVAKVENTDEADVRMEAEPATTDGWPSSQQQLSTGSVPQPAASSSNTVEYSVIDDSMQGVVEGAGANSAPPALDRPQASLPESGQNLSDSIVEIAPPSSDVAARADAALAIDADVNLSDAGLEAVNAASAAQQPEAAPAVADDDIIILDESAPLLSVPPPPASSGGGIVMEDSQLEPPVLPPDDDDNEDENDEDEEDIEDEEEEDIEEEEEDHDDDEDDEEEEDDDDDEDEDALLAAEAAGALTGAEAENTANAAGASSSAAGRSMIISMRDALDDHPGTGDGDENENDDDDDDEIIPESEEDDTGAFSAEAVLDVMSSSTAPTGRTASEIAAAQQQAALPPPSFDVLLDNDEDQFMGVVFGSSGADRPGPDDEIDLTGNGSSSTVRQPSIWYGRNLHRNASSTTQQQVLDVLHQASSNSEHRSSGFVNPFEEYDMAVAAAAAGRGESMLPTSYRSILAASSAAAAGLIPPASGSIAPVQIPFAAATHMPHGFGWAVETISRRADESPPTRSGAGEWPVSSDDDTSVAGADPSSSSSAIRRFGRAYAARLAAANSATQPATTSQPSSSASATNTTSSSATRTNPVASTLPTNSNSNQQNRSTNTTTPNSSHPTSSQQQNTRNSTQPQPKASLETTQIMLARTYCVHIRQLVRVIDQIANSCNEINDVEQIEKLISSHTALVDCVMPTWLWLISLLDALEGQLRYGYALKKSTPLKTSRNLSRLDAFELLLRTAAARNSSENSSASSATTNVSLNSVGHSNDPHNFIQYAISLMRGASDEHGLCMPPLKIEAYKHVALCFDVVLEFWRAVSISMSMLERRKHSLRMAKLILPRSSSTKSVVEHLGDSSFASLLSTDEPKKAGADESDENDKYFGRSPSLDAPGRKIYTNEPFSQPLSSAMPLAIRPYLYSQRARPEDMFGSIDVHTTQTKLCINAYDADRAIQTKRFVKHDTLPFSSSQTVRDSYSANRNSSQTIGDSFDADSSSIPSFWHIVAAWRYSLRLFACAFLLDMPALLREPYFAAPFHVKEMLFRRQLDAQQNRLNTLAATAAAAVAAHGSHHHMSSANNNMLLMAQQERELKLHVSRDDKSKFLGETFRKINQAFSSAASMARSSSPTSSPYITGSTPAGFYLRLRLNVSFENEPAEGAGVTRSFFTALADYLRDSNAKLPVNPASSLINWWSLAVGTATPPPLVAFSTDSDTATAAAKTSALRAAQQSYAAVAAHIAQQQQQRASSTTTAVTTTATATTTTTASSSSNISSEAAALWGLFSHVHQQPNQSNGDWDHVSASRPSDSLSASSMPITGTASSGDTSVVAAQPASAQPNTTNSESSAVNQQPSAAGSSGVHDEQQRHVPEGTSTTPSRRAVVFGPLINASSAQPPQQNASSNSPSGAAADNAAAAAREGSTASSTATTTTATRSATETASSATSGDVSVVGDVPGNADAEIIDVSVAPPARHRVCITTRGGGRRAGRGGSGRRSYLSARGGSARRGGSSASATTNAARESSNSASAAAAEINPQHASSDSHDASRRHPLLADFSSGEDSDENDVDMESDFGLAAPPPHNGDENENDDEDNHHALVHPLEAAADDDEEEEEEEDDDDDDSSSDSDDSDVAHESVDAAVAAAVAAVQDEAEKTAQQEQQQQAVLSAASNADENFAREAQIAEDAALVQDRAAYQRRMMNRMLSGLDRGRRRGGHGGRARLSVVLNRRMNTAEIQLGTAAGTENDRNRSTAQNTTRCLSFVAEQSRHPAFRPTNGGPESLSLFIECGENNTFYAPRPLLLASSTNTAGLSQYYVFVRQNAYRNVGRLIGIAIQSNSLLPLPLARHVLNYILRRPSTFYDFGFYNPSVFEQMRRLVLMADESGADESFELMDLYFTISIQFGTDDGAEAATTTTTVPLVPGGDTLRVTRHNVKQYVRLYTQYRMIGACALALDALRAGVEDVLGSESLDNDEGVLKPLQPEDLRLILCGDQFGQFDVQMLQRLTSFFCESGSAASTVDDEKIKAWFWAIVDKLSEYERHDLLLFWTGSPNMPASEGALSQLPSVTIRPPDDQYFPTANTCISRLYLPAYSSRTIMKQKLLVAIKTKNFGFV